MKIVLEAASLSDEQLGAFLRGTGLHETHLDQWRTQMLKGLKDTNTSGKSKKNSLESKRIRALEKELKRKDKALAETAALLVLKKKSSKSEGTRTTTHPATAADNPQVNRRGPQGRRPFKTRSANNRA